MATKITRPYTHGFLPRGVVKDNVYGRRPSDLNELQQYIVDAFELINSNNIECRKVVYSVHSRLWKCFVADGMQFEFL